MRDVFFVFEASFAIVKHSGHVLIEGSGKGQSESLFALRNGNGSVHGLLLDSVGLFVLNDFPSCSSYLLVHLHVDFGSSRHRVLGFSDCSSSDSLARNFELAGYVSFKLTVELFFILVEEEENDLRFAVLFEVLFDFSLPAINVRITGNKSRFLKLQSKGGTSFTHD